MSAPLPWLTMLFGRFYPAGGREQAGKRYRFPRSLKVTRLGKWYIAALLLIGVAAINTGNNLLYMVVGMLLSLIIISGIMSEATLRGVRVTREFPKHIFAGTQVVARLSIENTKRVFPSYSFVVSEAPSKELESEAVYILKLTRGSGLKRHPAYIFKRRGRVVLSGLEIKTTFPFALFKKGRHEDTVNELIINPRIWPIKENRVPSRGGIESKSRAMKKGDGFALYGLRNYIEGEDSRRIDWKSSARARELLSREFEREEEERVLIVFDNSEATSKKLFEDAVSEAASLAVNFIKRGFYVGLKTRDEEIECGRTQEHLLKILNLLALIGPSGPENEGRPPSVEVLAL